MKHDKAGRLAMTEKAKEIVARLTLEQKVSLMGGNMKCNGMQELIENLANDDTHYNFDPYPAGGIEEEGVPPMLFCDGPRGIVCGKNEATCFPVSMARGATFDPALEEAVGHVIGKEARAYGGNLFAGVCINLPYNPGWGRSQETYGEDPFQIGQMGAALVRGVQDEDIMACVKHFAFNQMENARFKVSVTCDQRTEQEVFLPHFKDCIDAGAASVMSSYNRYNGVHCGHSNYLLNQVLKKEWDFDGFVMSDFIFGVKDTVEAANGGQDMEMCLTQYFGPRLVKAVEDGFVPEAKIDEAAVRIIRTILAFDKDHKEYDKSVLGCAEHAALAKKVADESITLLKNEEVLPMPDAKKILVLGELADKGNIGDHGSSWVRPRHVITPLQGLKAEYPDADICFLDGKDLEAAKEAARHADAVVFVAGYNHDDEGEFISEDEASNYTGCIGGDRRFSLGLHQEDIDMINAVGPENKNSVVVLIGGNMIMMTDWIDSVGAVLMAYYPGQEGGTAIAEILSGKTNPSGKIPFVIPYEEKDLPWVDWNAADQYYEYYHGYTRLDKNGVKPLRPYGFGMSYTTFAVSDAEFTVDEEKVTATCKVTNTGNRDGKEVVQFYVGCSNSAVDRPVRILRGFKKVEVKAGETKEVVITCPLEKLRYYNPINRTWVLEKMEYEMYLGTTEAAEDLIEKKVVIA